MNFTVTREGMGGVMSAIQSALNDKSYTGSVTFGGTDAAGNQQTVTITFADETPKS
jgi:lantibiotic modifying enzyme